MSERYIRALEQRIERLERAMRQQVSLSRSTAPAVDTGAVQTIQGRIDPLSLRDGMPVFLNYGFSGSLPMGGDKAILFLGGDRSQGIVVATNHQTHRFQNLNEGETVMHDMWSHCVHMTEAGIAISGNTTLVGNLAVTGAITATGNVTAGFGTGDQVDLLGHDHTAQGPYAITTKPNPGT